MIIKQLKLSNIYKHGDLDIVYLVAYDTGFTDEIECLNQTFCSKDAAKEYAKANKHLYLNKKLHVIQAKLNQLCETVS